MTSELVEVEGRRLRIKNRDKVLYPETGFTKGDLIDYYREIAPAILPHLRGRPVTLRRFPDGVDSEGFWEKRCPAHRPDWIPTVAVWSEQNQEEINYCSPDALPTLLWLANLGTIELHASLSRAEEIERPTVLAFDLDPGPPADILDCCRVALSLCRLFDYLGLASFPKTSGSKGLQVYVPLNSPVTYEETKGFARALAQAFEERQPDLVLSNMKRDLRKGKVFIDWSQNDQHKTTVGVYSVRATKSPGVSTPVTWEEVAEALESGERSRLEFGPTDVLSRYRELGDLFAPVEKLTQSLPSAASLAN
jgi:bifunctional non-homologous end joining protein LigD